MNSLPSLKYSNRVWLSLHSIKDVQNHCDTTHSHLQVVATGLDHGQRHLEFLVGFENGSGTRGESAHPPVN